ncbi:MAG: VanW family protein [Anaerolineaceae bacterium]|nr:VanW family protein [Anaerolineaceae bacterium]MBN2677886.1 VanW family protein [Anaerolineaceae bacterium]
MKIFTALTTFFVVCNLFVAGISSVVHILYDQRILPGVSVNGVALGGMTRAEAGDLLEHTLNYPVQGRVVLKASGQSWVTTPINLGFQFDHQQTTLNAYQVGRDTSIFSWLFDPIFALLVGNSISPVMIYNEKVAEQYMHTLALHIDQPAMEAHLGIKDNMVELTAGQIGRNLDVPAALLAVNSGLAALRDFSITLPVQETRPAILDASEQAVIIQRILFAPLILSMPEGYNDVGPWVVSVESLAQMLVIDRIDQGGISSYQVTIDQEALRNILHDLEIDINREVQNARFIFNDDTRLLDLHQSAVVGRRLDVATSVINISQALLEGEKNQVLVILTEPPTVLDDATGDQLGIHELIWAETSYYYGSSPERIQNIKAAADRFHGLLVPPGAVFSMAEALGDISLDNGYAEALIIFGDQTIKGIGGGVCQVSTTLFRTAFHAGFPISERHAHAYRVSYYEQRPNGGIDPTLAGLDATVFVPLVDVKFTNDTPYWLLMETYARNTSITWKFYSTADGRSVEWHTTGPMNIVEAPEPLYRENPDLEKDEIKQLDWEAEGADVNVTRLVYRNGSLLFHDEFRTHYLPWQAVFEYGPGTTDIPTPES